MKNRNKDNNFFRKILKKECIYIKIIFFSRIFFNLTSKKLKLADLINVCVRRNIYNIFRNFQ